MRKLTILLALVMVGIVCVSAGVWRDTAGAPRAAAGTTTQRLTAAAGHPAGAIPPAPVIDGAVNPEMIPDHVAYSTLFALIAGRRTEAEAGRARAYVRQMGLKGADVEALVAAAEEFRQQAGVIDRHASQLRSRYFYKAGDGNYYRNGSPVTAEDRERWGQLRGQREVITADTAASLRRRLSGAGWAAVRRHVVGHMKRGIRMTEPGEPD